MNSGSLTSLSLVKMVWVEEKKRGRSSRRKEEDLWG